ncbi:MAG: RnfABCDGE type electron transport complex subunit C [Candidatus Margulisiibacteriota bacterium]
MIDPKAITALVPTRECPEAEELYFPLPPSLEVVPLVERGDNVKVGQCIANGSGNLIAPLHSSVSGVVTDLKPIQNSSGGFSTMITIRNDSRYHALPFSSFKGSLRDASVVDLRQRIYSAGIPGLDDPGHPVEELIINATEGEPFLSADHRQIIENTRAIFTGLEVAMRLMNPKWVDIAVDESRSDAVIALRNYALKYSNVRVVPLKKTYPKGADCALVNQITHKRTRQRPIDVGVLVVEISTLAQVGLSMSTGLPFVSRFVTLSGSLLEKKLNLRVRIGTPIKTLLGELISQNAKMPAQLRVIMGGAMTVVSQTSLDVPVTKETNAVLVLSHLNLPEQHCIRCARCVDRCPVYIMPIFAAQNGLQAQECVECGLCSYHCPSNIRLVDRIRKWKQA